MNTKIESQECRHSGSAIWLALIAAVGVGTAAAVLLRRKGLDATRKGIDDLVDLCDQAADALDQRVAPLHLSA